MITWQPRDQLEQPAIALDADHRLDKATILQALREAFSFPDYFGENWDAAYDLLLDEVDQLAEPALWRFSIDGAAEVNEADLAAWLQLMADVCAYADSHQHGVRVVIYSDAEIMD
ncbi:barstar family protein [Pseudomonas saliphila]|uniref:barstar family protein n=1 Tax=Pseudomonas saliphila TaxID=2586906 RepID=UPI001239F3B7|nr:barstar family protein [Pseudomonas saliphila]